MQDPLLMYPEEGKKIARTKSAVTDSEFYCPLTEKPLPPPRHKQEIVGRTSYDLIEL